MLVVILHPEQWNGGSDRCTLGMIKHFVELGHRVIWYTTMIDCYWSTEQFNDVEIRDVNLPLHPGDWWTQNVVLAWQLIFSGLIPDLIIIDHSASCLPLLKWRFPKVKILFYCHFPQQLVTPTRFFLYRWYSRIVGLIEESQFLYVMPEVNPSRLMVVYPPCDIDAIKTGDNPVSRKQCQRNNKHYTFLSMNRFWPEKN
ncbi:Glycosyltransferase, group 1 family protein [Dirofilaria immitis]|nr:Glycosyltransferase, group 1 family protein [Dirofilaria immitis]